MMDILHLVDRLEQTLNDSRRLPLTGNLLLDEDRVFNIIDQMRVAIPDAIKRANRVEAEKERILAQAKEEGDRIRELARQEALELVNRDSVVANAQVRSEKIIEQSHIEAENIKYGADQYAVQMLAELEENMTRSVAIVRNGLRKLESELQPPQSLKNSAAEDELLTDDV